MKWFKKAGVWLAIAAAAIVGLFKLRKKGPSQKELEASAKILDEINARDSRAIRAEAERRRQAARTVNPTAKPDESLGELLAKVRARRTRDDRRADD